MTPSGNSPDPTERESTREASAANMAARLAVLESKSENYATKVDMEKLKVWILVGVVSALVTALLSLGIVLLKFILER